MIPRQVVLLIPRLASEHVGELVATRNAIARLLLVAGLDWHDLARAFDAPTMSTTARVQPFGDIARACRDLDRGRLAAHERTFVADMCRRGFSFQPSPRQTDWLASIFDRLQARAA